MKEYPFQAHIRYCLLEVSHIYVYISIYILEMAPGELSLLYMLSDQSQTRRARSARRERRPGVALVGSLRSVGSCVDRKVAWSQKNFASCRGSLDQSQTRRARSARRERRQGVTLVGSLCWQGVASIGE